MATLKYSWERERNTSMKVFSQLYVGIRNPSKKDETPLGFATPYEDNAAGRKRQETVNNWLGDGRYYDYESRTTKQGPKPRTEIFANEPREGWRITDDIKRVYWGGGNVVWRVEDPLGYELEIQSRNLMAIIQCAGIEAGGLIPGKCILGRSGADNILLHETSDEYKDAIKAAELLKAPKQVGKASREIGGVYRLVDGSVAVYLGKVHACITKYHENEKNYGNARVEFPKLEGLRPGARTSGLLNYSTDFLNPSEEYEAVCHVEAKERKLGDTITLYKKAPLVQYLEPFKDIAITNSFLDSKDWQFASSAKSFKRITSVTVEKITDPVIKLLPWTEEQYDAARANIKQHIKSYSGLYFGGWFRSGEHAAVIGDEMMSELGTAGIWDKRWESDRGPLQCRAAVWAAPLVIGEGCFTYFSDTNDMSDVYWTDGYRNYGWSHSHHNGTLYQGNVKITHIPNVLTHEEYLAFFEQLYNDRALFNIVTRNKS